VNDREREAQEREGEIEREEKVKIVSKRDMGWLRLVGSLK